MDDSWQHLLRVLGNGVYLSPLHRLFAVWLWPLEPVRRAVGLLDILLSYICPPAGPMTALA